MSNDSRAARALLTQAGVMPVVTVTSVEQGLAIARALAAGGLTTIEITLRSAAALAAIAAIKQQLPQIVVGVGTVLSATHIRQSEDAGADFLVTPGTTPGLAEALAKSPLPAIPGVATPSEIMTLMELGFDCVKLFPAAALGGLARVKALAGPFPDLALCPTGGINEEDAALYLDQPNVLCVGGSWMLQKVWVNELRLDKIEAAAAHSCRILATMHNHAR